MHGVDKTNWQNKMKTHITKENGGKKHFLPPHL